MNENEYENESSDDEQSQQTMTAFLCQYCSNIYE